MSVSPRDAEPIVQGNLLAIRSELIARVHRERHAVVSRLVNGFLHLDVQLLAADRFADDAAWRAFVFQVPAARSRFLRIAAVVRHQPRRWLEKPEVCVSRRRYGGQQHHERGESSYQLLHRHSPWTHEAGGRVQHLSTCPGDAG